MKNSKLTNEDPQGLTQVFVGHLPPVVGMVLPAKQELELGVVPLLLHGHLLKLWAIPGNKGGQLLDDIPYFLVWKTITGFN